ncbi:hypothetical protein [Glycomyces buryatensis]|uniref:Ribbon-helix-helix protein, CopG family n=1 Tax=Glycomyces buryatensis TaxID=2570927 RepID=A0A4S8QB16_9ACTN|nr:hypothetical protein [Glycomyces buryatensis]THV41460.1 hypothetical protein FAB82_11720 [Glycomyces buryatensis]
MDTMILQIREVDADDVAVLRERARRSGISLSAYLRNLIHQDAAQPTNAEVIERIESEESVDIWPEETVKYIEAGRPQ